MSLARPRVDAAPLALAPPKTTIRPSCPGPTRLLHSPLPAPSRNRAFDMTRRLRGNAPATLSAATVDRAPASQPLSCSPAASSLLRRAQATPTHGSEPYPPLSANTRALQPNCRGASTTRRPGNSHRETSEPTPAP